jgi:hypothetical protein
MQLLDETTLRIGGVGDCWGSTWAPDGRQLTALCDGFGWRDMPHPGFFSSRMYSLEGDPHGVEPAYLAGYPYLPCTLFESKHDFAYYGFTAVATRDRIVQLLSTRAARDQLRFTGAKLIYSDDAGATWYNQDGTTPVVWEDWDSRNADNLLFYQEPGESFSMPAILQMGKGYEQNRDGYVYIYAPNGNVEGSMNELVLCRVPVEQMCQRANYQFFAGLRDGTARWSGDIGDREPVHTFPEGWVTPLRWAEDAGFGDELGVLQTQPHSWRPSVAYNAPLGVYMMANFGMGVVDGVEWFEKPSYLGLWIADDPWGPWSQVFETTAWTPMGDARARAYEAQIFPGWIAEDGRSFWLGWTDFQHSDRWTEEEYSHAFMELVRKGRYLDAATLQANYQPYYSLNLQQVMIG